MEREVLFRNRRGQRLSGVYHSPGKSVPSAAVLACHGFNDRKERDFIRRICTKSVRYGLAAFRFDFSGQGKSDGQFDQITYTRYLQDIAAAFAWLSKRGIKSVGILGHGMGGALAALSAQRQSRIAAYVGLAPVTKIYETHYRRWREQYQAHRAQNLFMRDIRNTKKLVNVSRGFLHDAKRHNLLRKARSISIPSLCIIGNKDARVYVQDVRTFCQKLKSEQKKLVVIKNCDHIFSGHENKIITLALDWFKTYLFSHLFIDTAEMNIVSLRLMKEGRCYALEKNITFEQRDELVKSINTFLRRHGVKKSELKSVLVVRGPGPFTAVRVGVTVANTLALALNIPVVGIHKKDMRLLDQSDWRTLITGALTGGSVKPFYSQRPNITKPKNRPRR